MTDSGSICSRFSSDRNGFRNTSAPSAVSPRKGFRKRSRSVERSGGQTGRRIPLGWTISIASSLFLSSMGLQVNEYWDLSSTGSVRWREIVADWKRGRAGYCTANESRVCYRNQATDLEDWR